jgi:hypothetical protein
MKGYLQQKKSVINLNIKLHFFILTAAFIKQKLNVEIHSKNYD